MPLNVITYSDFDINFIPNPITQDLVMKYGASAIVQSVLNLVQLNHFQVPFHPEIGSGVRALLFELPDSITANSLANEIKNVLKNFEPRVTVTNVFVDALEDGFNVTIEFTIETMTDTISVNTFLERLR